MKKISLFISLFTLLLVSSCGSKMVPGEENLTPDELKAVNHVRNYLSRSESLDSIEIVTEPMPAELMTDEYKGYRDDVYKAGLDYNSCKTRGIEQGMVKANEKILEVQNEIQTKVAQWRTEQGTSKYLFVLATVKTSNGGYNKLIAAFNPVTLQNDFMFPLTKPFVNNARMIQNAMNGTLFQYATDTNGTSPSINSNDPVVNFVLLANPATVR